MTNVNQYPMTRKQLRGLKSHKTAQAAYDETTKNGIIAVCVKTYGLDFLAEKEFYTYKSKLEYDP